MRVTICGHAALYVETSQHRILIDPCFSNTILDGVLRYNPPRHFRLDRMLPPTLLVVTHGHFDHWHPDSLKQLPKDIPVLTAPEPHLVEQLQALGFASVTTCHPWECLEWGTTRLLTTPSDHDEPEFGLVVRDETGTFWHMADAEVTPDISQQVLQQMGKIDLISVKYQPVVRASMGYQRNRGAAFDKVEVLAWLETACACRPAMVFPYASGLSFQGRHAWFNRYAFPLAPEEVTRLLQKRLGGSERAITVLPGDAIALQPDRSPQHQPQASPFVRAAETDPVCWEPVDLQTLAGLTRGEDSFILQQQLEAFFQTTFQPWLTQQMQSRDSGWQWLRCYEVVVQWVVHTAPDCRLAYWIDFRTDRLTATLGEHPEANFFTHFSGQGLFEVLNGDRPALLFWLSGDVRNYEKVMGVRDGQFWSLPVLPPEDAFCDPLSCYLRVSPPLERVKTEEGPPSALPDPYPSKQMQSLEILGRRGENDGVISKKVLLAYLAVREAERIGLEIAPTQIQAVGNALRSQLDLDPAQSTEKWLQSIGLTPEDYTSVLRDFTATIELEQHYAQKLKPMQEKHARILKARVAPTSIAPEQQGIG
ncbi:MBL fold metallo-hydrolase [Altericista sp. CCNU0014]|uniref:MBL fold metallo-hydrolase n=1 Tax=Altericista sp. CCNU0014 TaxID=3082949 RepID=UPI00384B05CB